MAKVRSILEISGTLLGLTFVDSRTYGPHARAKRGTYKPISLADGMKESSVVQTQVNLMAKLIFDPLNDFMPGFKNGKLWSRLLSVFRRQKKEGKSYSYSDFNEMEMRVDYQTSKHGAFRLERDPVQQLLLHYRLFQESSYRIRLLRIAVDATMLQPYTHETLSIDVEERNKTGSLALDFTELPTGAHSLYVLHCEQLVDGKPSGFLKSKGAKFLWVG